MKEIIKKIVMVILEWEARMVIAINKPKIIAITGSAGKTSTKDAIFSVLSSHTYARKSEKSFNNELGIPLTILGLHTGWGNPFKWFLNILEGLWIILWPMKYPKWLILEVGTRTPGDITKLSKWLKPDIVIMTSFGTTPVHVEFFTSKEAVLEEKKQLAKALKENGILILNRDDEKIFGVKNDINRKIVTYGRDDNADFLIYDETTNYVDRETDGKKPDGIMFKVKSKEKDIPISLNGVVGINHAYTGAAAIATLDSCGFPDSNIAKDLTNSELPPGRMKLISGIKDTVIIDDTYNAAPISINNALKTLREIRVDGRKIVVLGDMLELGMYSEEEHKKIGSSVSEFADIFVVVGARGNYYVEGALSKDFPDNNLHHFDDSQKAGKFLEGIIDAGDIILVKGSQGVRMERTVKEIMKEPDIAEYRLVRQEKAWLRSK